MIPDAGQPRGIDAGELREMDAGQLREILDFAVDAAQVAGTLTLRYFHAGTPVEIKPDGSPVTVADKKAEELLRERIAKAFPTHGILGEEFGETFGRDTVVQSHSPGPPVGNRYHTSVSPVGNRCHITAEPGRWILDPVDGTFSFIHGVPIYSVLIGFEWAGEMVAGVVHMPALRETVYAARGLGCYWQSAIGGSADRVDVSVRRETERSSLSGGLGRAAEGGCAPSLGAAEGGCAPFVGAAVGTEPQHGPDRARVSTVGELSQATMVASGQKFFQRAGREELFGRLCRACGHHRSWCDAYGYALVATGRADIALDPIMEVWDCAALLPIVTEAGGSFTDWSGRTTHTGGSAVATNGRLHAAVLRELAARGAANSTD